MRTYDKLIAAIHARQGTVGLRPPFGEKHRLIGQSLPRVHFPAQPSQAQSL